MGINMMAQSKSWGALYRRLVLQTEHGEEVRTLLDVATRAQIALVVIHGHHPDPHHLGKQGLVEGGLQEQNDVQNSISIAAVYGQVQEQFLVVQTLEVLQARLLARQKRRHCALHRGLIVMLTSQESEFVIGGQSLGNQQACDRLLLKNWN